MNNFNFSTIGIGSLSYLEPKEALDLILEFVDIPFWPQLPKRSLKEGMVMQYSEHIPCLKVQDKALKFDSSDQDQVLEKFYERIIQEDVDYFAISADFAEGLNEFITRFENNPSKKEYSKGHIVGPFTFGASVKNDEGLSLLSDPVMLEVIVKGLGMKALWQAKLLKKFSDKVIIFIDEPYLTSFGSAYTSINKEDLVKNLGALIEMIHRECDCLVGLHCCGNTDWGLLLSLDIDIINFDAYSFMDNFLLYSGEIKRFVDLGKSIAWGLIPTNEFKKGINKEVLFAKIDKAIQYLTDKGVDRGKLIANSLLRPSCGLGSLDVEMNAKILSLLAKTKEIIVKKLI